MTPDELAGLQRERLARLRHVARVRHDFWDALNDQGRMMVDRCLFATYLDCAELGVGFVARAMLRPQPEAVATERGTQ
jgi:hypothetical protein